MKLLHASAGGRQKIGRNKKFSGDMKKLDKEESRASLRNAGLRSFGSIRWNSYEDPGEWTFKKSQTQTSHIQSRTVVGGHFCLDKEETVKYIQ